jgi:predicted RNase H-like HicB family nuclease
MKKQGVPVPQYLPCTIEHDEDTGLYVGHCLTYDLVSTAKAPREAIDNLKSLIKLHVEYCYTHYKQGFTVTADNADWQRWRDMVNSGELLQTVEPIEVSFNEPWDSPAFWASVNMPKGVESLNGTEADNLLAPC